MDYSVVMTKAAKRILRGLAQTVDFAEGRARRGYRVYVPDDIDVRAIRLRAGLTQAEFAARFGFSLSALRHWEQGTRTPEGPTRAYLCVISRDPEAVERALRPLGEKSRS